MAEDNKTINQAVAEGGSYELIRKRLGDQSKALEQATVSLNQKREKEFGKTELSVIDRVRVRTENNCTPRDIVRIKDQLLFGYNVFIGLKKETQVADVFALYSLQEKDGKYDFRQESLSESFLADPHFNEQFQELYSYYKNTHLVQLRVVNEKLLAAFQIGEKIEDIRVFRWSISTDGVNYIDDRGERDIELPPSYDFEWHKVTREQYVDGKHPHISILDAVFVETVGGDLTIKIEDNTEDGQGIYREDVEDSSQSLDDADIEYAEVGGLILIKVLPYNEKKWRFFIFNRSLQVVQRIDEIGNACIQLPNDHGVIFPGGYYLQSGEVKIFSEDNLGLKFKRRWNSPNGEDILYVFYEHNEGRFALFSYNIIHKELQNPIFGHGYSLYEDGKMVIFRAESSEPTRIHPMQVWQTPYTSDEFNTSQDKNESYLATIGNAELVQGISELYSITKIIAEQQANVAVYEGLIKSIQRIQDGYYWLDSSEVGEFSSQLKKIGDTAELVLDEFEKVESISKKSASAIAHAEENLQQLLKEILVSNWDTPKPFVENLLRLKRHKGHLISLREYRYIDLEKLSKLDVLVAEEINGLGKKAVTFLSQDNAMSHYETVVESVYERISEVKTVKKLTVLLTELDEMSAGLDALSEIINGLEIEDSLQKTAILESISTVYSRINQTRAHAQLAIKESSAHESEAEFGAQLAVLSQSITHGVSSANTPDKCDEQLARLLVQLEELEGVFGENETFLGQILNKRDELHETFENRKQSLLDQQQRQAENIQSAAQRVLSSIEKRSLRFTESDQLNTYFSSDSIVLKITQFVSQLRALNDTVKADDIEAKLKAIREQSIRSLRDKKDIFEDAGKAIKLGKHKFSVNTQALDLTIVPKGEQLFFHLSGTEYYQSIDDAEFNELRPFWQQILISETPQIYRGEYLAYSVFNDALNHQGGLSEVDIIDKDFTELQKVVREYANPRYQDGYEKGVHDHDATQILSTILPIYQKEPVLIHSPLARAMANYYWLQQTDQTLIQHYRAQAVTTEKLKKHFNHMDMYHDLVVNIKSDITDFFNSREIECSETTAQQAARYLLVFLNSVNEKPVVSSNALKLIDTLNSQLGAMAELNLFNDRLRALQQDPAQQWQLIRYWLEGLVTANNLQDYMRYVDEAIVFIVLDSPKAFEKSSLQLHCEVTGLLGEHPNIKERSLAFEFDELMERSDYHRQYVIPQYESYRELKQTILHEHKARMDLQSFKARPLSSFVRNRLINQSYLPIIGDNLAKQMGTLGENKRTDLMGLLLLISPPGYGKTTLMEYVANRLGLNFMKINCPSLGHDVKSLDPANAPNATARQELEKLNLALEMGNNVMLYLDDIQHTHAEFLQKFISLCDGTRRIEGVWKQQSKTYDLRGKKFCVIMAGNPYTESGEVFKIPDMLANRADVYNLGDVLSGQEDIFSLSYVENSLTSNSILAPLALRDLKDVYLFMEMVSGKEVASSSFSHSYSSSESNEIIAVLKNLIKIQQVILTVNKQYIRSAAMDDRYRQEPPFKLQGSYRNMNKLAEKVFPIMDDNELTQLIDDHYIGEAQLLTAGAEENLLKFKELCGRLSDKEAERWQQIKAEFKVRNSLVGEEADGATKVASQISALKAAVDDLLNSFSRGQEIDNVMNKKHMTEVVKAIKDLSLDINVINEPLPGLDNALASLSKTLESAFVPVVVTLNKKLGVNMEVLEQVTDLSEKIKQLTEQGGPQKTVKKTTKKLSSNKTVKKTSTKK